MKPSMNKSAAVPKDEVNVKNKTGLVQVQY